MILFYFDFVSPYSWLGLVRAASLAAESEIAFVMRPIVYAALLDRFGLIGPAETEAKRRYTFHDVARCAERLGLALEGPPAHPFRSLEALRTAVLFRDDPRALDLCRALADACWSEGADLTRADVRRRVVAAVGLDPDGLEERIREPAVKETLKRLTAEAMDHGVFGVPTWVHEGELFWGHDRLDQLVARLAGRMGPTGETAERMLERPRAVFRKR